jgi:hypothetical protein
VDKHGEIASSTLGTLSRKGFLPAIPIRSTAGPTWGEIRGGDVDFGDKARDSAAAGESSGVKLFAKTGGSNKPRRSPSYNLLQTLFYIGF